MHKTASVIELSCIRQYSNVLIYSLVDSIYGGSGNEGMTPLDQQYQLFASAGAIRFPTPESEAWKEKVSYNFNQEQLLSIVHFKIFC